jgi:glycine/D-amino acid oxidase-like deaminating enzyme
VGANAGNPDVAIIGGGIIGCALAAFLAEDGASVRLYEREQIAAGASGRNSGLLQHPMDEALVDVFAASEALYRELGHGFALPPEPVGVLVVGEDPAALEPARREVAARFPELGAESLDPAALRTAEPVLAEGLAAYRLDTGRPVPPASGARAFAQRARAAGAELLEGAAATPVATDGRATGVRTAAGDDPAGAVVIAAGPWTSALLGTADRPPIAAAWGVNVELQLARPPRHGLEEGGVEALLSPEGAPGVLFSLITRDGSSALGSTFYPERPEPADVAPALLERGIRFVPGLAGTHVVSVRACARPMSADGRPLLGPLPGIDGLFVAAGHGPWGISLGPGSARLVADAVLGRPAAIAPELAAARFGQTAAG